MSDLMPSKYLTRSFQEKENNSSAKETMGILNRSNQESGKKETRNWELTRKGIEEPAGFETTGTSF